jgi:hypothetical protein
VSKLLGAIKLKMREIVFVEQRPFSYADFREFEVQGEKYTPKYTTLRNVFSKLMKTGEVQLAFRSKPAFYTLQGKKFNKAMTHDHAGVAILHSIIPEGLLKETPIYRWLKNKPFEKQALHDIRLTFKAADIWNVFSRTYAEKVNPYNKDVLLPTFTFFNYLDIIATVHHTDTVSVAISCSFKPVAMDAKDLGLLFEALTRTEISLAITLEKNVHGSNGIVAADSAIPSFREWIVKMWHFGVDTIDEYTGKEFEVTFEEGMSDLYRIYTKRMKDGKNIVRVEHQEYPNQPVIDALVRKLFPNGHLIVPGE